MPEPSLLQRLKERKLVQWAIAYLAGAFFIYTGLDPARETWGIPESVIKAIHILLIFGFFITLILAWYHGEKGRQRVSGPELLLIALLFVIAGGGLSILRDSGVDGEAEEGIASPGTQTSEDPRPSIIVLACRNISPDPEDAYVAEGLHEAILHRLAGVSGLRSLGRETANWYRDNPKPPTEIAAERGLDFVGECSIRKYRDEDRIFVTFQLLDANGAHVWSEEYDRDLSVEAEFEIQADVARQVAERVQVALTQEERLALEVRPTESLEAYDAYQLGRYLNSLPGTENARRAISLLKEAIELDPEFSQAYVELGYAYRILGWYTVTLDPTPLADSAQMNLERAVELDNQNAEAFAQLSSLLLVWRWDLTGAEAAIRRALSLDPNLPVVRLRNAYFLFYTQRLEQALAELRRAQEEDPLSVIATGDVGLILRLMGSLDEAKAQYERALDIDPSNTINRDNFGRVYLAMNMPDSAIAEFQKLAIEDYPGAAGGLVHAFIQLGDRDVAHQVYGELQSISGQTHVPRSLLAWAALPFDENQAFDLLAQAVEERDPNLLGAMISDWWSYREHPRYREILNSMGFDLEGERLVALGGGS